MISDDGTMNDGGMTHGHVLADQTRNIFIAMENRVVLNVGSRADPDYIKLGSNHDTEHDYGVCANRDMTMKLSTARHKGGWIDLRFGEFKRLHFVERTRSP